jgi:carbamoyltransferase
MLITNPSPARRARPLQVLEQGMGPRLYALLEAYGRRNGIPVLLNTSFNLAGEPIVNRIIEGYSTFRRCGLDVLVAGQVRVTKHALGKARSREYSVCSRSAASSDAG